MVIRNKFIFLIFHHVVSMRSISFVLLLVSAVCTTVYAKKVDVTSKSNLVFIENKGQIKDQYGKPRKNIDFVLQGGGGMNIFIGAGEIHYQFTKTDIDNVHQPGTYIPPNLRQNADEDRYEQPYSATITTYRLDVAMVGANKHAQPVTGVQEAYYENYYLSGGPIEGIRAHSYKKITYKNVYPDIDWVIYTDGVKLEHEFVVGSKGNAGQVKLTYSGQTKLTVDAEGNIVATTPMGTLTEKAPVCYGADGKMLPSKYKLKGNELSYDLGGVNRSVLIDPELIWGTYYGPVESTSPFYSVTAYDSASLYACGLTWSGTAGSISTVGSHQVIFGGETDGFLVKFDTTGVRQWATYYGGSASDWSTGVVCDMNGMVYMCGVTGSSAGITTPGAQQAVYGGGTYDAFLVKFLPDGTRVWGTYAGGPGVNYPWSVCCDMSGKVYLAGDTNEGTNIATPSGYRPAKSGGFDWYLIQYDTMGVRTWGTYYGGPGNEFSGMSCTDGYVAYMTGWTVSTTGISSAFAHQTVNGGTSDAALIKFIDDGTFAWATYYGGTGSESVGSITCDVLRNVYLLGHTDSDNGISTTGSYKPTRSGSTDAFLVKFHPELGFRMWGTYFGGVMEEKTDLSRISSDDSANIYIMGVTSSTSGIATDTAWQLTYGGGDNDGFLAKFNNIGQMKWASYFGGEGTDDLRGSAYFGESVYICGQTNSTTQIATPDAYLSTGGGGAWVFQGFLARIADPDTSSIPEDTTDVPQSVNGNVNMQADYITVFPNPNKGSFSLKGAMGGLTGVAEILIADVTGRSVSREKAALHNGKLNEQILLSDALPAGVYYLTISAGGKNHSVSFRKE